HPILQCHDWSAAHVREAVVDATLGQDEFCTHVAAVAQGIQPGIDTQAIAQDSIRKAIEKCWPEACVRSLAHKIARNEACSTRRKEVEHMRMCEEYLNDH